jgi:predicted site-specific integrase-resolvase
VPAHPGGRYNYAVPKAWERCCAESVIYARVSSSKQSRILLGKVSFSCATSFPITGSLLMSDLASTSRKGLLRAWTPIAGLVGEIVVAHRETA